MVVELLFTFNVYIIILYIIHISNKIDNRFKILLYFSFIIRIYFSFYNRFISFLPDAQSDAKSYESFAWDILNQGTENIFQVSTRGITWFYSNIISLIYFFTDRAPLLIQSINILLGILSLILIYQIIILLINNKNTAFYSCCIFAFYPSNILYNSINLKETIIVFFATLSILYFVKWYKTKNDFYIIIFILFSSVNLLFHSAVFLICILFLISIYFILIKNFIINIKNKNKFIINPISILITFFLIIFILSNLDKLTQIPYFSLSKGKEGYDFDFIRDNMLYRFEGNTVYPLWLIPNNFSELIFKTPLKLFYFLFSPFFWQIERPTYIFAFIDSYLLVLLFALILFNIKKIYKNEPFFVIFISFVIGLLLFALATGNFGTAVRHKYKLLPFVTVLFSVCISSRYVDKILNYIKLKFNI